MLTRTVEGFSGLRSVHHDSRGQVRKLSTRMRGLCCHAVPSLAWSISQRILNVSVILQISRCSMADVHQVLPSILDMHDGNIIVLCDVFPGRICPGLHTRLESFGWTIYRRGCRNYGWMAESDRIFELASARTNPMSCRNVGISFEVEADQSIIYIFVSCQHARYLRVATQVSSTFGGPICIGPESRESRFDLPSFIFTQLTLYVPTGPGAFRSSTDDLA